MYSEPTLSLVRSFREPIISFFGKTIDQITQFLDNGLPYYIESQKNKFEYGKTFLFKEEQVKFMDIYMPLFLSSGNQKYTIEWIEDLYVNKGFTAIIGNAGSGKSMQIRYIFLRALYQRIKIPIFIELKALNDYEGGGGVEEYISERIIKLNLSKNKDILNKLFESGHFLFLLDGYDEIYSKKKQKITHDLEEFIDRYSQNWFVLTSRPEAGLESFPRFNNNTILGLEENQVEIFIKKQCDILKEDEFRDRVLNTIKDAKINDIKEYLSNPLLLSMFLFTYRNYPQLPNKKSKFYWNVYDTLVTKHDSFTKRGGWQHERRSDLKNEEFKLILMWFSYIALFDEKFKFDKKYFLDKLAKIKKNLNINFDSDLFIYDVNVSLNLIILDGLEYTFVHKSLQEYFSVLLIAEQTEDVKKKIYKDKFENFNFLNLGTARNVFSLCMEMDKYYFIKYFLLHHLDNILSEITDENVKIIIANWFEYFSIGFQMKKIKSSNKYEIVGRYISMKASVAMLEHIGLDYDSFVEPALMEIMGKDDFQEYYSAQLTQVDKQKSNELKVFLPENHMNYLYKLLCSLNIDRKLYSALDKMTEVKNQLEKDLDESNSTSMNLLGI